ncbi:MAG: FHA domain-containing protein [Caldilineaceae bacterium]
MTTSSNYQLRVRGPEERRIYPLPCGETIIGYDPAAGLFLNDRTIESRHVRINEENGVFSLTNLHSESVTRLNNEPLIAGIAFPLRIGDNFQLGSYTLTFEELARAFVTTPTEGTGVQAADRVARLYPYSGEVPPGVSRYSLALLPYLPTLYQTGQVIPAEWDSAPILTDETPATFLARFLALFESVQLPLAWLIENFQFYLDPLTAPVEFFPWLESWYGLPIVANLTADQRRQLLLHAHELYNLKGSHTALVKVLHLCTGCTPVIDDLSTPGETFRVEIKAPTGVTLDRALVEQLIIAFKPVHTSYELKIG